MEINKQIFKYIFEIIFIILLLCISYPMWEVFAESKGYSVAKYYEKYKNTDLTFYYDKVAQLDNLYPIFDEDVDNSNYTSINIVNNTLKKDEYKLIIAIEKSSTLDSKYLKINIDDSIYKLNDLYYSSDEYLNYFLIDSKDINSKETINKKVVIWLDSNTPNFMQNKTLDFKFKLI